MPCLEDDDSGEPGSVCAQQWVWREIYDDTRARLAAVSLADLAAREQERLRSTAVTYSI
jgi:DNA-binding IscR family transcriptional regulator